MVDFGAIIGESAEWTKKVLFSPFNFKKWMVLTFIALMAGAMSNGCNFNGSGNGDSHYGSQQKAESYTAPESASAKAPAAPAVKPALAPSGPVCSNSSCAAPCAGGVVAGVVILAALVVILAALFFLLVWLGARFSFVFLESVVKNDASIKVPFRENKEQGNSYYQFNLWFILSTAAIVLALIIPAVTTLAKLGILGRLDTNSPDIRTVLEMMAVLAPFILLFIIAMIVLTLVSVITIDLVLPIMYKEKIRIRAGWGKAWSLIRQNKGNFAVYVLIKIGLGIGAGIVYFIAFILGFLIVVIPLGLLVYLLYLISKAVPAAAIFPYWLVIGLVLAPVCIFLLYCLMSFNLPFAVFFRTYSLKFLERLDPQYGLIKTDKPVAAQ